MSLWLYSSGDGFENAAMDTELAGQFSTIYPRFTFIPASSSDADDYYDEFIERFSRYGYKHFNMMAVDQSFSPNQLARTLASDLIYLSGGNTFHFLKHARESGFLRELKRYVELGGVLAGHSAGAIMMTPTIRTAGFPDFDRDENYVELTNLKSCHFVDFEIFPHFQDKPAYQTALGEASLDSAYPLFALADGAGVAVRKGRTSFYGQVTGFFQGKKFRLT